MSAQSRPSEFVALGRLLRDLDDPARLRGNALVRGAFGGGEPDASEAAAGLVLLRLRAAVLRAVASLDVATEGGRRNEHFARQRTIVTRCDLRGEKHAAVARDLGVSLREFYRERRRAFERLLDAVSAALSTPRPPVRALPTPFELELDHVAVLRLVGDFDGVFAELENLARATTLPEQGVRAWCYGVEIAADLGDAVRAQRFLALALLRAQHLSEDSQIPVADLDVGMASAYVAWQDGDYVRSTLNLEQAVRSAERLGPLVDRHAIRSASGALFRAAELACLRGDPGYALELLARARILLDRLRHRPPDLLGQLFLELSVVQASIAGGMTRALAYAREAFEIFESGRDVGGVADAAGMLCSHLTACGDVPRALGYGRTALRLARASGNAGQTADKALILSVAESAGGDPRSALLLAQEARMAVRGGLFALRIPLAAAEAYLRLGAPQEALSVAAGASEFARARGLDRYVGCAARIAADAHADLGDERAAREELERALAHLSAHGHPPSLVRVYETGAKVVKGSTHAKRAAELRDTLHV